jgi:hypothetical protein
LSLYIKVRLLNSRGTCLRDNFEIEPVDLVYLHNSLREVVRVYLPSSSSQLALFVRDNSSRLLDCFRILNQGA